jgi:carbon monoxide dehydrogenase subunit G
MARYVVSIAGPRSPAEAFGFMADLTHFSQWDPGVKKAVQVVGDGPGLGAAYDLTVAAVGTMVMRYVVTSYEAPRRVVVVAKTRWLTSIDEITVESNPAGSLVTYDAKLTLRGPLALFDGLLARSFRRIGDRAAAGLRRALGVTTG